MRPIPSGSWAKSWSLTALIVIASLSAIEGYWRWQGHLPSVVDDKDLWCLWREKVSLGGPDDIVLLGNSRILCSVDTAVFAEEAKGHRVFQLGIAGTQPIATLIDLAEDESFRGIVVYDLTPLGILPGANQSQEDYVRYYHSTWNTVKWFDRRMRTAFQECFVYPTPQLNPVNAAKHLATGRKIAPLHAKTFADRRTATDFTKVDVDELTRQQVCVTKAKHEGVPALSSEPWTEMIGPMIAAVKRIESRGGRVVMLRNVSSGGVKDLEEEHLPRERTWDVIARIVSQSTRAHVIHFEDVPEMARLKCGEGAHLDYRDAVAFTKALAKELRSRNLLKPSRPAPGFAYLQAPESPGEPQPGDRERAGLKTLALRVPPPVESVPLADGLATPRSGD